MALKVQYNKTFMQQLKRQLQVRLNALPTLQAKESALRLEVKRARDEMARLDAQLKQHKQGLEATFRLWKEFPQGLLTIANIDLDIRKIAGVKIPLLNTVHYTLQPFSLVEQPSWLVAGVEVLKQLSELKIRKEVAVRTVEVLEYARKKTTQKVNLYEKVQIPAYQEALLKIKRIMEDEENLAKSSQKILKTRMQHQEVSYD
jgi:V/A-type H+-transporting ATPase subunit D